MLSVIRSGIRRSGWSWNRLTSTLTPGEKRQEREEYNSAYEEFQKELHQFRSDVLKKKREETALKAQEKHEQDPEIVKKNREVFRQQRLEAKIRKEENRLKQLRVTRTASARRELNFKRETIRRELLMKAEDERYAELLKRSRTWIRPEDLDERIVKALDTPVALY